MPKRVKELKPIEVARLTHKVSKDGKAYNAMHPVGGVAGLLLQVTPAGAKSWLYRTTIGDKRRSIGLGSYPTVGLAEAREKAREARRLIEQGIDPIEERRAVRERLAAAQAHHITFDEAAEEYFELKRSEFTSAKHAQQWRSSLENHASPFIGKKRVDQITMRDVEELLKHGGLWHTKPATGQRVRGRIERVLDWCTAGGHREGPNPAAWRANLDARLPNPNRVAATLKEHHAALPIDRMPEFMRHLRRIEGYVARALEFAILTATRSNEARGAVWSEIDLEKRLWVVPADRSKTRREHRVPLSPAAVALLKALPREYGTDLVFPSPRAKKKLSQNVFVVLLARMDDEMPAGEKYIDPANGRRITAHGFRSTFRDWGGERTAYPGDVLEMSLAHTIKNKAEAAYRRSDLIEKRARLMEDWARFCAHGAAQGSVTPIRSKEA